MPLHWTVQSQLKLVTAVADGEVSSADFDNFFKMIKGTNVGSWRQLYDARAARPALTFEDVHTLGVRIRAADAAQTVGPLAFVMPDPGWPQLGRLLGFLAAAKRPMRLFQDIQPARKWLMTVGSLSD